MPSVENLACSNGRSYSLAYYAAGSTVDTSIALNSPYVYGSTGNCFCIAFTTPDAGNLTDVWIYVISYTGTWANTDGVINIEVRLGLNGSNKAGSSIVSGGSFTITLDGTTIGWVRKSGLSIALAANELYTISVADADPGVVLNSHYVTLSRLRANSTQSSYITANAPSSANGWSTGSSGVASPTFGLKYNGVVHACSVINTVTSLTSNSVRRGIKFKVPDWSTLVAYQTYTELIGGAGNGVIELYEDGVAPGGAYIFQYTIPAWTLGGGTAPIATPYFFPPSLWTSLNPNKSYRLVYDPSASQTYPRKVTASGSPDSELLNAGLGITGTFSNVFTYESGGAWVDEAGSVSQLIPVFERRTAPTISC